jgi:hypothetical protein
MGADVRRRVVLIRKTEDRQSDVVALRANNALLFQVDYISSMNPSHVFPPHGFTSESARISERADVTARLSANAGACSSDAVVQAAPCSSSQSDIWRGGDYLIAPEGHWREPSMMTTPGWLRTILQDRGMTDASMLANS